MKSFLMVVAVLFPIFSGAILPALRFETRRSRGIYVLSVTLLTSFFLLLLILRRPADEFTLLRLTSDLSIAFRIDGLGCVFASLLALLWPVASMYALEYIKHEGMDDKFFCFYTMAYGVSAGIALSANMLTMYLFYELLTLATLPLIMHAMNRRAVNAGIKYLAYSIGGAAMAFVGMVILYHHGYSSLNFVYGGAASVIAPTDRSVILMAYVLTFFGFGVKAAVFPFHGWLPTAGVAPTPVTALLHAVAVVKSGVFALMRSTFYLFGTAVLTGTWVQFTGMAFAAFTIVYGCAHALCEQHIKRRLAYSTVSNLSYIVFAVMLMTPEGLVGAMAHMLFHGITKITLFFCAGAVFYKTRLEYVPEIEGLGLKMKGTFATFTLASASLIGVPLLPGFISKWYIASAAAESGLPLSVIGVGALMISACLTAGYLLTIVVRAYFPMNAPAKEIRGAGDPNLLMLIPFAILCVAMLFLGTHSGWLIDRLTLISVGLM